MRTPALRIACAFVALALLPTLVACDLKGVTVRIADFESNAVDGVRFYRLDEVLGDFVPGGSVRFSEPYLAPGSGEVVDYTILDADENEVLNLSARLRRDPADPDAVTLNLVYDRTEPPGWFRISSFNAAGESVLSLEQIYL
jgi:hypothetical protein